MEHINKQVAIVRVCASCIHYTQYLMRHLAVVVTPMLLFAPSAFEHPGYVNA
jgi:inner membrane protein involved in colicin E2 resistance